MPALARRAWLTMGSWASLVTADPIDADTGRRLAAEAFESVEARLSSYRSDSEVSRFERGEVPDPSAELRHVLAACEWLETASGGMFSSWPAGPAGPLDLAGYVGVGRSIRPPISSSRRGSSASRWVSAVTGASWAGIRTTGRGASPSSILPTRQPACAR